MSKIAVMTDSNSGMAGCKEGVPEIYVLPMPIMIDGKTYYEGHDITVEEFYEKLSKGSEISTTQPAPYTVTDMWKKLLKEYDEVVYIPMSSGLSGSCQSSILFSKEKEFLGRVHVVDNHRISITQAYSALDARKLADAGYSGCRIKEMLEAEALDATIYIAVDTLEYLKKGGRITPTAAAIGSMLNLKPILTIQGERLEAYSKKRGMTAAFHAMCQALDKEIKERFQGLMREGKLKAGIAETMMEPEKLKSFKQKLQEHFPDLELVHYPLSMCIGAHVGPGGLGIGLFRAQANK